MLLSMSLTKVKNAHIFTYNNHLLYNHWMWVSQHRTIYVFSLIFFSFTFFCVAFIIWLSFNFQLNFLLYHVGGVFTEFSRCTFKWMIIHFDEWKPNTNGRNSNYISSVIDQHKMLLRVSLRWTASLQ